MAFPFQTLTHKEYSNTFLENTVVSLISKKWNGRFESDFVDSYPKFVDRFFGLQKDASQFEKDKRMSLTAPEDDITFTFRPDKVSLRVGRKKYHTFVDNILPELVPLKFFVFGVMKQNSIENLMVRKLNVFSINADSTEEVKQNIQDIYRYIYKSHLLDTVSNVETPDDAPWILDFRTGIFSNDTDEVKVRIGISQSRDSDKVYNVILDSSARCNQPSDIEEGAVDRILIRLNDHLFNAYHWCVSDNIIHLMEEKN